MGELIRNAELFQDDALANETADLLLGPNCKYALMIWSDDREAPHHFFSNEEDPAKLSNELMMALEAVVFAMGDTPKTEH